MGRGNSDEAYVLDLCDEVIGMAASRQHRFDWLLGDPGRSGQRPRVPVDGFWISHQLVVEYRELQYDGPNAFFDKPDRLTVSGVHRGQQRAIYDARRDELIPAHGLRLMVIKPSYLDATFRGRLRRNADHDIAAITQILRSVTDGGAHPGHFKPS